MPRQGRSSQSQKLNPETSTTFSFGPTVLAQVGTEHICERKGNTPTELHKSVEANFFGKLR
jgi:hypothetical protein